MINVLCFTNLDLHNEVWPGAMVAVPRVGDLVESQTLHASNRREFRLQLQVVRVTWTYRQAGMYSCGPLDAGYHPLVELSISDFHRMLPAPEGSKAERGSLVAFYNWYAPLVGKSVSSFI